MIVLDPVVEVAACFAAGLIAELAHSCGGAPLVIELAMVLSGQRGFGGANTLLGTHLLARFDEEWRLPGTRPDTKQENNHL